MLSNSILGAIALVVVWTTALLMAGAALKEDQRIAALARRLARAWGGKTGDERLVFGRLEPANGEAFATLRVDQVGRAIDTREGVGVQWSDRAYASEVLGGILVTEGGERIPVRGAQEGAAVWVAQSRRQGAGACADDASFETTVRAARTGRGSLRTVSLALTAGTGAWVFGRLSGGALGPAEGQPLLVAETDPRTFCATARRRVWAFVVLELLLLAGLTALCFVPPLFGPVSQLGAVGCLGFFLVVQPIGSWNLKNAVRFPHEALLRGEWLPPQRRPSRAARTRATSTDGT